MGELRAHFRPGVPQPRRRHRAVQAADARGDRADRRPADRRRCAGAWPTGASTLELTEAARELIAREGYDPVYGARPLRRFIQREVETRIGRALLSGEIRDGATITLDVEGDELVVTLREPGPEAPAAAAAAASAVVPDPRRKSRGAGGGQRGTPPSAPGLPLAAAAGHGGRRRLPRGRGLPRRPCPGSVDLGAVVWAVPVISPALAASWRDPAPGKVKLRQGERGPVAAGSPVVHGVQGIPTLLIVDRR